MRDHLRNLMKTVLQVSLGPDRFLWKLPDTSQSVALTFDDGPHPQFTEPVLDTLALHGIKATFFLIGRNVDAYPALARRIVKEGHAVGVHGYEHAEITSLDSKALKLDLDKCHDSIFCATGIRTRLFRPPRGVVSMLSLLKVWSANYSVCHWSKTYSDYSVESTDSLLDRMTTSIPVAGDIILLHDNNPFTAAALSEGVVNWKIRASQYSRLTK